jgi:uncharacterized protein YggT (Ycf19 family)
MASWCAWVLTYLLRYLLVVGCMYWFLCVQDVFPVGRVLGHVRKRLLTPIMANTYLLNHFQLTFHSLIIRSEMCSWHPAAGSYAYLLEVALRTLFLWVTHTYFFSRACGHYLLGRDHPCPTSTYWLSLSCSLKTVAMNMKLSDRCIYEHEAFW